MLKKYRIIFICTLLIISTLTGCIQGTEQGRPGGDAPTVVSVWYSLDGEGEKELLRQLEQISTKYNEVLVKGEKIPEDEFVDYTWKTQAGGQGPDIIIARAPLISALYEKGAISPVLAESKTDFTALESMITFNNKLYAVPWLTDVPLLYYRKDNIKEIPGNLNNILAEKETVSIHSLSTSLLRPWWRAQGGTLSQAGVPRLDSRTNQDFMQRVLELKDEGLLILDNQALEKLVRGEVNYTISWAGQSRILQKSTVEWDCLSLEAVLGNKAKPLLDGTIAIANSSIKTVSTKEKAILLVEKELLALDTQIGMAEAGKKIPAIKEFYDTKDTTINNEIVKTIENSWVLPANVPDWHYLSILEKSWLNILAGEETNNKVQAELEKAQQAALELQEQT